MTFNASAVFQQAALSPLMASAWSTAEPGGYGANGLSADAILCALYGNTGTPSKSVSAANSCYPVDQWVTGNEVTGGANWPAGGLALTSKAFAIDTGSSSLCFSAASVTGNPVTIAAAFGCLIYDHTISSPANQGLCYNYFGGTAGVTAGSFTVSWPTVGAVANTIFNFTV